MQFLLLLGVNNEERLEKDKMCEQLLFRLARGISRGWLESTLDCLLLFPLAPPRATACDITVLGIFLMHLPRNLARSRSPKITRNPQRAGDVTATYLTKDTLWLAWYRFCKKWHDGMLHASR